MARRQKWQVGDIFVLPLLDQTYSVGQVLYVAKDALNSAVCGFFTIRLTNEHITDNDIQNLRSQNLLSVQFCTVDLLNSGRWKVVANRVPLDATSYFDIPKLENDGFVGARIIGSRNMGDLMNAFYKLTFWDSRYDPRYFDNLLVSPDKKPQDVLLK